MELYWNERLLGREPDEDTVEGAVERLRLEAGGTLELRMDLRCWMRVSYRPGTGYFMDVGQGTSLFGLLVPETESEAVAAALLELRRGGEPRPPWELLAPAGGGPAEFVAGEEEEHDCPLCALLAAEAT